ncbi:hypothetical protein [Paenibacillus daejeonensis]|uniref:hypothetical protein n=1 Tax=Paenibacillus daejeonensis TaxID=135193 RepID=UPI00036B146C|nr:hypothetical protein [Paenibacillus daejeonensis]
MSQANIPNITPTITVTREQSATMLLSSIALEEMALAHIMNAEAEKIQYVLGTLHSSTTPPSSVSISQLLEVNKTVRLTLQDVVLKEVLLQIKFANVLELLEKSN